MNGIRKNERIWATIKSSNGVFYITSKNDSRDMYYIYKEENEKAVKIGKGKNPLDLERRYIQ